MMITGTKVFIEAPEIAAELDLAPFDLSAEDLTNDQTLIHTQFFTCEEASVEACWQAVFNERSPSIP